MSALPEPRFSILCVDDEPSVLEVLQKMLERRYEVLTAGSAKDALLILRQRTIDVLITDQKMPELMARIERDLVEKALEKTGGNRSHAAKLLGISRRGLLNKIARYSIDR